MLNHAATRVSSPSDMRVRSDTSSPALVAEEARVREAYARRSGADRYSWHNRAHLYAMQEVERGVLAMLSRHQFDTLSDLRILDVGCGSGGWLREFVKWGAKPERLAGIDLLEERVAQARQMSPPGMRLEAGSAAALPFEDASFDVVVQSLVFTSIIDADIRQRVASEMIRVVRPGGLILWYDYHVNNPANRDVRAVDARELARLFKGHSVERRHVTLAPPLARLVAPRSKSLYSLLATVPLLKTHYLAAIRRS